MAAAGATSVRNRRRAVDPGVSARSWAWLRRVGAFSRRPRVTAPGPARRRRGTAVGDQTTATLTLCTLSTVQRPLLSSTPPRQQFTVDGGPLGLTTPEVVTPTHLTDSTSSFSRQTIETSVRTKDYFNTASRIARFCRRSNNLRHARMSVTATLRQCVRNNGAKKAQAQRALR